MSKATKTKLNPIISKSKGPTQEENEVLQKQPLFLDKINNIIETMESKYTSNLTDRHVDEILKLINEMNANNYAFHLLILIFHQFYPLNYPYYLKQF